MGSVRACYAYVPFAGGSGAPATYGKERMSRIGRYLRHGRPVAFSGVCGDKLEMLFVHPSFFGRGIGRVLVRHAADVLGVRFVDVNEQNTGAAVFYRRMGFAEISRDETDSQGMPYPVLHMELVRR